MPMRQSPRIPEVLLRAKDLVDAALDAAETRVTELGTQLNGTPVPLDAADDVPPPEADDDEDVPAPVVPLPEHAARRPSANAHEN